MTSGSYIESNQLIAGSIMVRHMEFILVLSLPLRMKEYARAEEVLAGFGVDLVSASDLSHRIGVSEMV